jgi:hypothetical protein
MHADAAATPNVAYVTHEGGLPIPPAEITGIRAGKRDAGGAAPRTVASEVADTDVDITGLRSVAALAMEHLRQADPPVKNRVQVFAVAA